MSAKETTAMNGAWRQGPGVDLFTAIKKALGGKVRDGCVTYEKVFA